MHSACSIWMWLVRAKHAESLCDGLMQPKAGVLKRSVMLLQ